MFRDAVFYETIPQNSLRNNSYFVPKCILKYEINFALCFGNTIIFNGRTRSSASAVLAVLKMLIEFLKLIHSILIATKTVMLNGHRICQF